MREALIAFLVILSACSRAPAPIATTPLSCGSASVDPASSQCRDNCMREHECMSYTPTDQCLSKCRFADAILAYSSFVQPLCHNAMVRDVQCSLNMSCAERQARMKAQVNNLIDEYPCRDEDGLASYYCMPNPTTQPCAAKCSSRLMCGHLDGDKCASDCINALARRGRDHGNECFTAASQLLYCESSLNCADQDRFEGEQTSENDVCGTAKAQFDHACNAGPKNELGR
jgi:hypothetical protein